MSSKRDAGPQALSRESSIFLLTSIFNNSIHSSIAVFHLEPQIHEKWKGRIAKWQPRKRAARKRAARKSSSSLARKKTGDAKASPFVYLCRSAPKPLDCFALAISLLHLLQAARRDSGQAAEFLKSNVAPLHPAGLLRDCDQSSAPVASGSARLRPCRFVHAV
jgi:hypothetical protein